MSRVIYGLDVTGYAWFRLRKCQPVTSPYFGFFWSGVLLQSFGVSLKIIGSEPKISHSTLVEISSVWQIWCNCLFDILKRKSLFCWLIRLKSPQIILLSNQPIAAIQFVKYFLFCRPALTTIGHSEHFVCMNLVKWWVFSSWCHDFIADICIAGKQNCQSLFYI